MKWLCDITYNHRLYAAHRIIICPYTSTVYQAVAHWHPGIFSLYTLSLYTVQLYHIVFVDYFLCSVFHFTFAALHF